jgi:hypothetical protein
MHNLIKIESSNSLARDLSSHAVISTSKETFRDYHRRKTLAEQQMNESKKQQDEIDALKNDISEIKTMLQTLIKR